MSTQAGWYDDGSGHQRYWDGSAWTEHTQPLQAQATQAAGWYDDGSGTQRYWDGLAWTEHTAPVVAPPAEQAAAVVAAAPVVEAMTTCPSGHETGADSAFCRTCGLAITDPASNEPEAPGRLSPRARRLQSDYEALMAAFAGHPAIAVTPVGPMPPERYQLVYNVPALAIAPDMRPHRTYQTIVDLYLPPSYPREKPYLTTNYQVFHPNFGAHVCIADYWSPSDALVDVVIEVGDLLQWRKYNVKSPLNAVAANWAAENTWQLPVGGVDVMPLAEDMVLHPVVADNTKGAE